jgi:hypothetical protein
MTGRNNSSIAEIDQFMCGNKQNSSWRDERSSGQTKEQWADKNGGVRLNAWSSSSKSGATKEKTKPFNTK